MNRYTAEAIATFVLVFAGCGAIVTDQTTGGAVSHVGVGLTFGLVVMAMIYAVGDVSGAHLNPAVTVGFWLARRLPGSQVAPYVAAQCVGAVAASVLLWLLFPDKPADLGATLPTGTPWQSLLMETVLTAILMFVILNVSTGAKEKGLMAGVAVGGTIAVSALFAGPVSGASMNPARSLGPALVSMNLTHLWVYLVGPLAGASVAVLGCRCVQADKGCCAGVCDGPEELEPTTTTHAS